MIISIFINLSIQWNVHAQPAGKGVVSITEEDGSPDIYPWRVKFTNATVTDNGDGTASVSSGGGAINWQSIDGLINMVNINWSDTRNLHSTVNWYDADVYTKTLTTTNVDINKAGTITSGNDSFTKLLTHLNNNVTDSSNNAFTVTNNNVTFANSSPSPNFTATYYAVFNGTNATLTVPSSSDFEFGSGDFTIDYWSYQTVCSASTGVVQRDGTTSVVPWMIGFCGSGGVPTVYMSSTGASFDIASAQTLGTGLFNQWVHFEVDRSGNNFYAFENGIQRSTWSSASAIFANSNPLSIGVYNTSSGFFVGDLQELRISKGVARHTGGSNGVTYFTPNTSPYGASSVVLNLRFLPDGSLKSYISYDSALQSLFFYNNAIIGFKLDAASKPFFPTLTTNGYVKTSSGNGTLGIQAVPIPVADGGTNATSASITAFNNITGYTASGATGTTSTNLVFSTSPVLTTPTLGAATYTTLSGGNVTDSALTSGRVTIAGTSGILADDSDLTFATDTLTMTKGVIGTTLTVPNSSNPTISSAGNISVDTSATSGSMIRFFGDASYQLPGYYSKSFVVTGATSASDFGNVWRTPWNITIRAIHCLAVGGTNVVGQLTECDANGTSCAVIDSSDITCTAGTNSNDDGTLSNSTVDANDYLGLATTSTSGTNTNITWTFEYTVDAVN